MDEPTTTTITFSKPVYELLKQRAKNEDRSLGSVVRLAVEAYLYREQREQPADDKPTKKGK